MNEENRSHPLNTEKIDTVSGDNAKIALKSPTKGAKARAAISPRTKKRLVLVGVITGIVLLALIGTIIAVSIINNRPPEFSTVRERFEMLIERSQTLNNVVWGEGLPTYKRVIRDMKSYVIDFKGEEEKLGYFEFQDNELGTVISYEYQIRRMEGKLNENGVKIYTVYDVETGGVLTEYKQGAARFARRVSTPIEGKEILYQTQGYYYYALPKYENPDIMYDTIVYTGREDENYDYVRFDGLYKSTAEVQKALAEVYANDYMAPLYEYLFTGGMGGMNDVYQPAYSDYVDQESDVSYLMKANSNTIWKWKALRKLTFDFSTMQMLEDESDANSVKVTVQYRDEGKDGAQQMTVSFARESGNWYLNSPTY